MRFRLPRTATLTESQFATAVGRLLWRTLEPRPFAGVRHGCAETAAANPVNNNTETSFGTGRSVSGLDHDCKILSRGFPGIDRILRAETPYCLQTADVLDEFCAASLYLSDQLDRSNKRWLIRVDDWL